MFCVAKKNKDKYLFILSERTRDKVTKKVKSKDKYILTLDKEDILNKNKSWINRHIRMSCDNKKCTKDELQMVLNKCLNIKTKLITEMEQLEKLKLEESQKNNLKKEIEEANGAIKYLSKLLANGIQFNKNQEGVF